MGSERMHYRPEIDGLRAICVLGVILFHAGANLPGGFVGVDVFFVISGFLITGIIASEMQSGRFRLVTFWERRIRRIYPALALTQIVTLVLGICLYLPQELNALAKSSLYLSLSVPNVHFRYSFGYFTDFPMTKPLLHTWSLGVEEQFYVIFPLIMTSLSRLSRDRRVRLLAMLAAISFLVNLWWVRGGNAMAAFYLLPARAWELLAGCTLALRNPFENLGTRWREFFSAAGLCAIFASMATFSERLNFPGYWAVIPVAGAWAFIAANATGMTRSGRITALGGFVAIGKLSYSLYLWHWPLIAFPFIFLEDFRAIRWLFVAMTFPVAFLAWKYVETPIRRRTILASRRSLFLFFAVSSCTTILLAGSIGLTGGMRFRLAAIPGPVSNLQDSDLKLPEYRYSTPLEHLAGKVTVLGDERRTEPAFLLWGDSHSLMTARHWDELARREGVSGLFVAQPGLNVVPRYSGTGRDESSSVSERVIDDIARRRITHVILVSCWTEYLKYPEGPADFAAFLDTIARRCPETKVHVFDDVPFQNYDPPRMASYRMILATQFPQVFDYRKTSREQYEAVLAATTSQGLGLTRNSSVSRRRVDPDLLDGSGHYPYRDDLHFHYSDNNHLTLHGVQAYYGRSMAETMREIAAPRTP